MYIAIIIANLLLMALPCQASDFNYLSLSQGLLPESKPKAAVIVINTQNEYSAQYKNDLLLSLQNELLINGIDIVIGKENALHSNTLIMNIDFSIESGILTHVQTENQYSYFVENISRATYKVSFSTTSIEAPFFDLSLSLDTLILGLTKNGYDSIETINGLFGRSANLMANIYFASFTETSSVTGTWHDMLGSTVIDIPDNQNNGKHIGYVKTPNQYFNSGFTPGDKAFRISSQSNESAPFTGELKVNYLNGKDPEWLPAEFILIGNIMVVKPSSSNAPVGMSFFQKRS
jgi:hypothetical protein